MHNHGYVYRAKIGGPPGSGGTGAISINGKKVATGRIERTIPFLLGPDTRRRRRLLGVRAIDHEADRASVRTDGPPIHPRQQLVSGEQRGEVGVIASERSHFRRRLTN